MFVVIVYLVKIILRVYFNGIICIWDSSVQYYTKLGFIVLVGKTAYLFFSG